MVIVARSSFPNGSLTWTITSIFASPRLSTKASKSKESDSLTLKTPVELSILSALLIFSALEVAIV